jgi:hypothetical protein
MTWEELHPTTFERVRHYTSCTRDVFYCQTDDDLAESVRLNRCVAIDAPEEERVDLIDLDDIDLAPSRLLGVPSQDQDFDDPAKEKDL